MAGYGIFPQKPQQVEYRERPSYIQQMYSAQGDPKFRAYFNKLRTAYKPKSQDEFNTLYQTATYDFQKGTKFADTGVISRNPWEFDDNINQSLSKFVVKNRRMPKTDADFNTMLYEGQYGTSVEDQRAQAEGLKPWKYQVSDSIKQKIAGLGDYPTAEQLQALIDSDPAMKELSDYAATNAQNEMEKPSYSSAFGTPAKKYENIDVEGLKGIWDPLTGFKPLLDNLATNKPIATYAGTPQPGVSEADTQRLMQQAQQPVARAVEDYYAKAAVPRGVPVGQMGGIKAEAKDLQDESKRFTAGFFKGFGDQTAYEGKDLQWMVSGNQSGQGLMSNHITSKIQGVKNGNYVITPGQINIGLGGILSNPAVNAITQGGKYFTLSYIDDSGKVKQTEKFATAGFAQYAANKYRQAIIDGKPFKSINQLDPNAVREYLNTLPPEQQQQEALEIQRYTPQRMYAYALAGPDTAAGFAKSLWSNFLIDTTNAAKAAARGDLAGMQEAQQGYIPNAGWREWNQAATKAVGGNPEKSWSAQLDKSWAGQQLNNVIDMLGDPVFVFGGEFGVRAGMGAKAAAIPGSIEESMAALNAARFGGVMAPAAELNAMERYKTDFNMPARTEDLHLQLPPGRGNAVIQGQKLPRQLESFEGRAQMTQPAPAGTARTGAATQGRNVAAEAERATTAPFAETESNPLFRGQEMGGANPAVKPAQSFETSKSGLSYRDKVKIAIQDTIDPNRSLKYLPGTKGIKGETNAVYRGAINSKNVQNQIANIYEVALVDRNGNKIGDSLMKLFDDNIPRGQEIDFWTAAMQKHNMARAEQGKPIFSQIAADGREVFFSAAESKAAYNAAIAAHPEWAQKIDNITGWLNKFEKAWGVDTGLFTEKLFNDMKAANPNYLPSNRSFNDLEDFIPGGGGTGKGFLDQTNTIRTATGSTRNIIDPTENIINLVSRTVRSARMNEVGQLFVDVIRRNPEGMEPIAELVKAPKANVDNVMRVLVKGEPVYVKVNDAAVLDSLAQLSAVRDLSTLEKVSSKITGFMKSAITTNNPVFGLLNGFRDIQTYLAMSQVNPLMALGRYARAGAEIVASDVINPALRKLGKAEIATPKLNQFRALGGEGSTLTGAAPSVKKAQQLTGRVAITDKAGAITGYRNVNPAVRLGKWLGKEAQKFNTAIEATPRYAEYLNALKKGKTLEEALYDAAEITTNFSRGGKIIKEADSYTIYLNASVQGLSRLGRALNPANPRRLIGTLIKGGIAVTLPTAVLFETNKDNPNYQELSNNIKDNYYLVPNIFDRDEQDNPKTFIRIPKSREIGVLFGAFYERARRAARGEENAYKGLGQSFITNATPNIGLGPTAINPVIDLARNKNFYGGSIVPESLKGRSPHLQFNEKTSEPSKWLANALYDVAGVEVSPIQLDYLADAYLGIISDIGLPVTTKKTYEQGISAVASPITRRFTANPLYSSQTITDFYDELDRLTTIASDANIGVEGRASTPEERQLAILTNASKDMSALSKQLNTSKNPEDIRRQMIDIAKEALKTVKAGGGSKTIYPPGVDDSKREAYDKIIKGGIPEAKMQSIFTAFMALKPRLENKTVTEKDRKDVLFGMVRRGILTEEQYRTFVKYYYPNK